MNIGIVCYPTHGGSGVVATDIGHALAQRGHAVHIISYATPFRFQPYQSNMHYHEVEVSAYPLFRYPPYDLALANTIMDVVESEGLELIHAHYAIPNAISALLAREMLGDICKRVKVVTTLHGTDVTIVGQERGYQRITRYGIEKSDAVTIVSEALAKETTALFGLLAKSLHVIHNFVDTERFAPGCCPDKRGTLAFEGEKIVMHLSNFREVKRPLDVIEAFAKICRTLKARLIMLGDGPLLRACKDRSKDLKIADRVRFLGTVDTPWELLPQADVFFLPSEHESFGLAALEAMSCGVPVVASNTGGISEVLTHGETGFLSNVGDVAGYAKSMEQLLSDPKLHKRMADAARAHAVDRFSEASLMPRWEQFYDDVLAGRVS
ncbi:MAG: N-acetyl-alpha-D-glucosaminyl L-malate synthase BshA [Planctomycetes bacterium]|nr:N-acetyl-alpha-D-glucosaminyl L-malate synthase BshA [Planctomycetota bacterium]NUQ34624.1 N-acetyl-alpha-D-glucosaminyl L-malate synthase BshA [Planctomycetaceae bacterium]